MTEKGPSRWDEGEFPDAPLLLSPKTIHQDHSKVPAPTSRLPLTILAMAQEPSPAGHQSAGPIAVVS
jgi:hypothetical protein